MKALAGILLALAAGTAGSAWACPDDASLTANDLLGLWRAEFEGGVPAATLLLEPNATWPGSLAGAINRNGRRAQLAGDLEAGEFTLEESADGVRIDAAWVGAPVAGRCGQEIRGTWQPEGGGAPRAFTLRRVGGR